MATNTTSPNMNLTVPTVDQELGPTYAYDINISLGVVDSHNHTSGKGVPIPVGGLNINADLPFNGNNATLLRSSRFTPQSSPLNVGSNSADLGCVYVSGADLYYNDTNGNQVRMTNSGGVAGSPGSISGLVSPASATYVGASSTFVWQSGSLTPANLDAASILLRNLTASSKSLTLNPPAGMVANYSITLPTLPGAQSFLVIDSSGNITAPLGYPLVPLQNAFNSPTIKTSLYPLVINDFTLVSVSSGSFQIILPSAIGVGGQKCAVMRTDNLPTIALPVVTTSSQSINQVPYVNLITQNESFEFISDNSQWRILNHQAQTQWQLDSSATFNASFGSVSGVEVWWKRDGSNLYLKGQFAPLGSGSPLPSGYIYPNGFVASSAYGQMQIAGTWNWGTTAAISGYTISSSGGTLLGFSDQDSGHSGFTLQTGSFWPGGVPVRFEAGPIRIEGWSE